MASEKFEAPGCDYLVVEVRSGRGVRIVTVSGEADVDTEDWLGLALHRAQSDAGSPLVVDLVGLSFCSDKALCLLAEMASSAACRGDAVAVVGLSRLAALMWLLTGIPIPVQYATVERAVAALSMWASPSDGEVPAAADVGLNPAELEGLHRVKVARAVSEQTRGVRSEQLERAAETALAFPVGLGSGKVSRAASG